MAHGARRIFETILIVLKFLTELTKPLKEVDITLIKKINKNDRHTAENGFVSIKKLFRLQRSQ